MPRSTFMRSSPVPYSEVEVCVSCQLLRPEALGAPVDFGLPGLFLAWARALVGGMGQDRLFDPNVVPHGAREEVLAPTWPMIETFPSPSKPKTYMRFPRQIPWVEMRTCPSTRSSGRTFLT